MIYLLDSSALITANNTYYPIDQIPEFWEWLIDQATKGVIKIPQEIYDELLDGNKDDPLYIWAKNPENNKVLLLNKKFDIDLVQKATYEGYAKDLTDDEIEQLGHDPFILAYALAEKQCCVVTTEVSKPSRQKQNRHMPDVCKSLGIECCDTFSMNKALGFKTSWKS